MKIQLWEVDGSEVFVKEEEIKQVVNTKDYDLYLIKNIKLSEEEIDELNEQLDLQKEKQTNGSLYGIEEFLQKAGYEQTRVEYPKQFQEQEDMLIYDIYEECFDNLLNKPTVELFEWHNGDSIEEILSWETETITTVKVVDTCIALDDSDSHENGQYYQHVDVYKVLQVNEKEVTDSYLLKSSSQQDHLIVTGTLLSENEFKNFLLSIDRDVDKYVEEVKNLMD